MLDDVLRGFGRSTMDDVVRGTTGQLDDAIVRNRRTLADAFTVSTFDDAVRQAEAAAASERRATVDRWFSKLGDKAEVAAERQLLSMMCKARLLAQDYEGDVDVLGPWVRQEFASIGFDLSTSDVGTVANWLTEKVNDKTSAYSLACMAYARSRVPARG
jgi:hypothetical protein